MAGLRLDRDHPVPPTVMRSMRSVGWPTPTGTPWPFLPQVLTKVTMIGNDLTLDPGVGTCGKDGQGVPVGVGQPTLLVDGLTVGGTAAG